MDDSILLDVQKIEAGYDGKVVITDVSLSSHRGEIVSILGPNGTGKTTLLRCIDGTLHPIAGNIYVNEKELRHISDKERGKMIASVPQIHRPVFPLPYLKWS